MQPKFTWQQESPPAWTQEAYRPPRNKYTLCCSCLGGGGVPRVGTPLLGGYPRWAPPCWGVPQVGTPAEGGYPRQVPPCWGGTPGRRPLPGGTLGGAPTISWMGYPLISWMGYPLISWMGYPPTMSWTPHHELDGVPPHHELDRVPPPHHQLDGVPPHHQLDGVPPLPPSAGWGTPPPPGCEQTNKLKILPPLVLRTRSVTRQSSCVNARDIPPAHTTVLAIGGREDTPVLAGRRGREGTPFLAKGSGGRTNERFCSWINSFMNPRDGNKYVTRCHRYRYAWGF